MLASQALKALFAWGAGLGGGTGAFFTALSGARASGGPVSAGGAYLVGERGPEVFVPRSSGNIIPNGGMGGITMNYTIDARGADAERIMAVLPAMLKRTKDETVAAVMDLQRRGRFA
jgi:phage-related minor tail protein